MSILVNKFSELCIKDTDFNIYNYDLNTDANNREKLLLMEDVTKLKKLSDISIEDIAQKKEDLERVQ